MAGFCRPDSIPMSRPGTTTAAESRYAAMATQRKLDILDQQAQKPDPDKVSRVVRKSPVSGRDIQRFFGTDLRPKALIDLPQRICKEGPAVKPRSTVTSDDLDLPHELIEAILSHLPTFDLIVATGINMTFRTIVQNSPMLQRKLFLRPMQGPPRYVQVEHPHYGRRTIVAGESSVNVDEHNDSDDRRDEHDSDEYDGEADASDDPEPKSDWQWSGELLVATLCPLLLHKYHGNHEQSVRDRFLYEGGASANFSRLAVLAEHWANMYLTNPPCTEVIAHLEYYDDHKGQCNLHAMRTVYCESGITIAALLNVLHMEGDVEISKGARQWASYLGDDMLGVRKDTTISDVIEDLEEHSCRVGKIDSEMVAMVIKFPGVVFREWRVKSGLYRVRPGSVR